MKIRLAIAAAVLGVCAPALVAQQVKATAEMAPLPTTQVKATAEMAPLPTEHLIITALTAEMPATREARLRPLIMVPVKTHQDWDFAQNMLDAMYDKAKASNASLSKRDFILAFHDKAVKGDVDAGYYYGAARALGYGVGDGPEKEVEGYIGTAAKAGKLEAERDYALLYAYGNGVPADKSIAYSWAKKSADGGLPSGRALAAEFVQAGVGTEKDAVEAAVLFKQAAEAGDPIGALNFARIMMNQDTPDYDAAIHFHNIAAKAGDDRSLSFLGVSLLEGRGSLTKDDKLGIQYIQTAATIGNAGAQDMMGDFYADGEHGLVKDPLVSRLYYEAAAANGDSDAEIDLGVMYLDGTNGLAKDHDKGMELMMKAAKAQNPRAAETLRARL